MRYPANDGSCQLNYGIYEHHTKTYQLIRLLFIAVICWKKSSNYLHFGKRFFSFRVSLRNLSLWISFEKSTQKTTTPNWLTGGNEAQTTDLIHLSMLRPVEPLNLIIRIRFTAERQVWIKSSRVLFWTCQEWNHAKNWFRPWTCVESNAGEIVIRTHNNGASFAKIAWPSVTAAMTERITTTYK